MTAATSVCANTSSPSTTPGSTDLLGCHATAGIQLRALDNLWPFWDAVIGSTTRFSGIRLRNATPRPKS